MVMSIAGALVSAFAVPLNPRDPTTVALRKGVEDGKMSVLEDDYIIIIFIPVQSFQSILHHYLRYDIYCMMLSTREIDT